MSEYVSQQVHGYSQMPVAEAFPGLMPVSVPVMKDGKQVGVRGQMVPMQMQTITMKPMAFVTKTITKKKEFVTVGFIVDVLQRDPRTAGARYEVAVGHSLLLNVRCGTLVGSIFYPLT